MVQINSASFEQFIADQQNIPWTSGQKFNGDLVFLSSTEAAPKDRKYSLWRLELSQYLHKNELKLPLSPFVKKIYDFTSRKASPIFDENNMDIINYTNLYILQQGIRYGEKYDATVNDPADMIINLSHPQNLQITKINHSKDEGFIMTNSPDYVGLVAEDKLWKQDVHSTKKEHLVIKNFNEGDGPLNLFFNENQYIYTHSRGENYVDELSKNKLPIKQNSKIFGFQDSISYLIIVSPKVVRKTNRKDNVETIVVPKGSITIIDRKEIRNSFSVTIDTIIKVEPNYDEMFLTASNDGVLFIMDKNNEMYTLKPDMKTKTVNVMNYTFKSLPFNFVESDIRFYPIGSRYLLLPILNKSIHLRKEFYENRYLKDAPLYIVDLELLKMYQMGPIPIEQNLYDVHIIQNFWVAKMSYYHILTNNNILPDLCNLIISFL